MALELAASIALRVLTARMQVSYEQLVQASAKDYLDWYILTQVRPA